MSLLTNTTALVLTSMAAGGMITVAVLVVWQRFQNGVNPLTDEDIKR